MQKPGFSAIGDVFARKPAEARLRGWIKRKRELKNKLFFLFRDETGELQGVVDRDTTPKELAKVAEELTVESSLEYAGKIRPDTRAPGGLELDLSSLKPVHLAEEFPINRDLSTEFLLDVRHLWVRSAAIRDALKVRQTVFEAFRDFHKKKFCTEVQCPMFVSGAVEGGATLFEVPYFGKKVFLTQSSQFYLEVMIYSMGGVYTIAPSFRAEESKTSRHLTEFWHAEGEYPWMEFSELLDFLEEMVQYMVSEVLKNNEKELKALGRNPDDLRPSAEEKFERMRYRDVLDKARKKFSFLKFGSDLGEKEEREITRELKKPTLVTHYPASLKPFYHRPNPEDEEEVLCVDVLAPEGYGEIIGGGERCWKKEELLERMKEQAIDPKPYQWYIDLRRFGSVPHSGFGMGLDRMTSWLCKAQHIRDVIPFPRTMNRYYP